MTTSISPSTARSAVRRRVAFTIRAAMTSVRLWVVPPARKNRVSYHGVLAPRHRFRNQVIPVPPAHTEERTRLTKKPRGRSRWHPWADLLWRVFGVDGLACACGGSLVLHAIVQPPATLYVLDSLRRSANRNARAPPMAS